MGDDTAVLDMGGQLCLVTKDLLVEGIHFDMAYTPLKHLGYKAITVNLSDIYAMNGRPKQVLVGLAVSAKYTLEALEELYEGMRLACAHYQVDLVGGDTTLSTSGMMISVTAVGVAEHERVTYRSGARDNDLICVSGDLGAAYCGLLVLQREKKVFAANPHAQPDMDAYAYVLERQLKPEAGKKTVEQLAQAGVLPTAMIDISDGLASEVLHICSNSRLGAVVYEEKIPVDHQTATTAREFGVDPVTAALNGGEDYELLFTIQTSDYEKVKDLPGIHIIGHMTPEGSLPVLISVSGQQIPLKAQGWDHFRE